MFYTKKQICLLFYYKYWLPDRLRSINDSNNSIYIFFSNFRSYLALRTQPLLYFHYICTHILQFILNITKLFLHRLTLKLFIYFYHLCFLRFYKVFTIAIFFEVSLTNLSVSFYKYIFTFQLYYYAF